MSSKALDKFYTSDVAARTFIEYIQKYIKFSDYDNIIEPSAGAGALLNQLPSNTIGVDLMPERDDIIASDFFDYVYPVGKNITVGNPPFGSRSKLAVEFFKHAAKSSDAIAFIIPVTWEKFSIHKQLPLGWSLVGNERLPEASFELDGKPYRVRCTMQVWVKQDIQALRKTKKEPGTHPDFSFIHSDGVIDGTADWDVSILRLANPDAPPRKWLTTFGKEEGRSKVNRIYIKFHSEEAKSRMLSITIDRDLVDGMMPRVTENIIVNYYNQMIKYGNVKAGRATAET